MANTIVIVITINKLNSPIHRFHSKNNFSHVFISHSPTVTEPKDGKFKTKSAKQDTKTILMLMRKYLP